MIQAAGTAFLTTIICTVSEPFEGYQLFYKVRSIFSYKHASLLYQNVNLVY